MAHKAKRKADGNLTYLGKLIEVSCICGARQFGDNRGCLAANVVPIYTLEPLVLLDVFGSSRQAAEALGTIGCQQLLDQILLRAKGSVSEGQPSAQESWACVGRAPQLTLAYASKCLGNSIFPAKIFW